MNLFFMPLFNIIRYCFFFQSMNLYFSVVPDSRELCYRGNIYNNDLELTGSHGTLQSPQEPDYYLLLCTRQTYAMLSQPRAFIPIVPF